MDRSRVLEGQVLLGKDLELRPARLVLEQGRIAAVEELTAAPPLLVAPAFFNAHTHLGDTVALDLPVQGSLEALVTPPEGLKHRILAETPSARLVEAMRASLSYLARSGSAGCADFREGGPEGVHLLRQAARDQPVRVFVLGRDGGERSGDGLGVSSVRDVPNVETQVASARREGKPVALHAGERDSQDVETALSYDPDLLVHATHATRDQLRRCADQGIPIAVCPRSNWMLGVTASSALPPLRLMRDLGCTIFLGTDNVMFVPPNLFEEMAFVHTVYRMEPRWLLRAAIGGSSLCGPPGFIEPGTPARILSLDVGGSILRFSRDPCASLIKRVNMCPFVENVLSAGRE